MKTILMILTLLTGVASGQTITKLAEKEICRYVYLRTGKLQPCPMKLKLDRSLGAQEYRITSDTIAGGSDIGVLYGAYRYAEHLGVRFYLHGDVIPDERLKELPVVNDSGKPLFVLRGVNPWGAHPFGIDAWSADDYKAIFAQLAKMRMNFLGIHSYPESQPHWGPEPAVWHGLTGDFDAAGQVTASYPSRYFNILGRKNWTPKLTSQFSFGGSLLFERDDWAPPVMQGHCPAPTTPAACNEVFNRMGAQLRDAFTFARTLGVKTCIGTEAPLDIPKAVRERLKAQGKNPDDPACVRKVYEGTFRRIMAAHPLDYYWIWTPEQWTWSGNKPKQYSNTIADVRLAIEALKNSGAPFKLATCGWVLGPQHDRAAFDHDLPKNVPMSAISRVVGWTEVDPAFGRIQGREKWAIPWFESDEKHGLAALQLFVGRMRRDAADAFAYGCTGLMGLHWRTDILAPNAAALAQAAWNQSGWNPSPGGKRPVEATPTVEGPVGGNVANYPGRKIANTTDAPLYQTCRYGLEGYNLKLPNGRYRVTLKFCEPHFDDAGQRVGDYKLQGRTVIENLDIFARVGKFAALDFAFDNIEVTDGWLRLRVEARTSLPLISAILVEGAAATRKINCGGPAYKDYAADVQAVATAKKRDLPCDDFYDDWARANFGLAEAGKVFAAVDGRLPMSVAGGCPSGSLKPDSTPWEQVVTNYNFVAELETFRPRVKGAGNLERFDWWLNTFRYHRALHQLRCVLAQPEPSEITRQWRELYRLLLATVNTPGGLAMVVNLENHAEFGPKVLPHMKAPLPKEYEGQPRIIVPTVRSVANKGESLNVKIIALPATPPTVHIRPLGKGAWKTVAAKHVARAVYEVKLPVAQDDFEYYVTAGKNLVWPATAPSLNQTVVVW
ncbi:MAG: hypothetical protein FJ395_16260 [Verrucomicrobia bacterium]|nr:hypothetical protein [Verrucomicrobiota bacterium]